MFVDDYGHKYETVEDARKAFEKEFEEEVCNNMEDFSEMLLRFANFIDILEVLDEKNATAIDTLKKHYSKQLEETKKEYANDKIEWELEEVRPKKYTVTVECIQTYEVIANSEEEAYDKADELFEKAEHTAYLENEEEI